MRSRIGFLALAAAAASSLGTSPAAGQSRETLETSVQGLRNSIVLEWTKKHQWDAQLIAAPPVLVAEYRLSTGRVVVDCMFTDATATAASRARRSYGPCPGIAAEGDASSRQLRYQLPARLAGAPVGPVCLIFQMPNQRAFPIRRPDGDKSETARFRYAPWEASARALSDVESRDGRVAALRDSVALQEAEVRRQEASNRSTGAADSASCLAIRTPNFGGSGGTTRPVADDRDRQYFAPLVCTMRVWHADSSATTERASWKDRLASGQVQPPAFLDALMAMLAPARRSAFLQLRAAQWDAFRRDWERLGPRVPGYRKTLRDSSWSPHFGDADGVYASLNVQSLVGLIVPGIIDSVDKKRTPDGTDVAGYIGASLEAYSRCVSDGLDQMKTAYESAAELDQRAPALQQNAQQALIRSCMSGVEKLRVVQARLAELRTRLAAAERELEAARPKQAAYPDRPEELNRKACSP